MAPSAIYPEIIDVVEPKKDNLGLPVETRKRLDKAGIDLSTGYPYRPLRPLYLQDVYSIRNKEREHVDPGSRADPAKQSLLSAATKVTDLTTHIGTEIEGLQLKDLTGKQKDELGLLIAERSVVFFRDQDISPQQQKELGEWYGEVEVHVSIPSARDFSASKCWTPLAEPDSSHKSRKCQACQVYRSSGRPCKQQKLNPAFVSLEGHQDGTPI